MGRKGRQFKNSTRVVLDNQITPQATVQNKGIVKITDYAVDRSKKDIIDWRVALMAAESPMMPRRWLLTNLYRELELDPHIIMLINRFRRDLTCKPFVLKNKKTGKQDDEATKLIMKPWAFDVLKYRAQSAFHGNSLMQISEVENGEITKIDLVNRKFVIPNIGAYIEELGDQNLIDYRNDPSLKPWLIESDNGDLGYLNPAAPYILFKRNAFIAWSMFTETFGLPVRYVETDNVQPKDVARIKDALIKMGKNAYGIFHTGESLKFAQQTATDAYNVFYMLSEACNAEMSKMTLGSTLTSEVSTNGGSRALGDVHQDTSDETSDENRQACEVWWNQNVMPVLNLQGYGFENYEFHFPKVVKFDANQWTVYQGLLSKYKIDPQFFRDTYNVPILGDADPVAAPGTPPLSAKGTGATEGDEADDLKNAIIEAGKGSFHAIVNLHAEIDKAYNHKH